MIRPYLQDGGFLADVKRAEELNHGFHIWWLGQSGFLLQFQGKHLLFDPYLSDSLTRKYATTDKPHVRMTERVVAPEQLNFIDVVTSSHNHTDHLDAETLVPLLKTSPKLDIVIPEANREFVADRLKVVEELPIGLDQDQHTHVKGFDIHAVPSAHEQLERDENGRCKYLGYVVQFGGWSVYHSGDTMLYEGIVEKLRRWRIDLALLPINGSRPERRVAGNLDGKQAARLARDIGARMVIPCHYDMFEFNTASPEEFAEEARRVGQAYTILQAGERWSSSSLPAPT